MKRFLLPEVLLLCLMSAQMAQADEDRNAKIKAVMVKNHRGHYDRMWIIHCVMIVATKVIFDGKLLVLNGLRKEVIARSDSPAKYPTYH